MSKISKINVHSSTIVFLGYGAVAKCVWNYMDMYLDYHPERVHAIDQFESAFIGPKADQLHHHIGYVSAETFDSWMDEIGLLPGDIIIDLTYDSATYYFIRRCIERGFHYINTSIEDTLDDFHGTSINTQQDHVHRIVRDCMSKGLVHSNILTECGQNPGLIQHYILYALNEMRKRLTHDHQDRYDIPTLKKTVNDYQIGTIFCSEYDDQRASLPPSPEVLLNTWSVSGFLTEALEPTELVRGKTNPWIQPYINPSLYHPFRMSVYPQPTDYDVLFLSELGLHMTLPTIAPIWVNDTIEYVPFRGKLIHHGEICDLARVFGTDAPFMSYVYCNNPSMEESIKRFFKKYPCSDALDIKLYANQPDTFCVMDQRHHVTGQDSIGATIFCGKDKIERIFWCGSVFRETDLDKQTDTYKEDHRRYFTPTLIQVAAGVLSGLSFILEKENQNKGWFQSSDLDTAYMIKKSKALLGHFYMTEIPTVLFPYDELTLKRHVVVPELSKSVSRRKSPKK
jgi:homospermidine synthase